VIAPRSVVVTEHMHNIKSMARENQNLANALASPAVKLKANEKE
jgi:F0F1-type ATP synthase delta subunit